MKRQKTLTQTEAPAGTPLGVGEKRKFVLPGEAMRFACDMATRLTDDRYWISVASQEKEIARIHGKELAPFVVRGANNGAPAAREFSETFDQDRMQQCVDVFRKIHNHCAEKGVFDCCVVVEEPIEGKTLDELSSMNFCVGFEGDLMSLPFIDTLVVFKMIADQYQQRTKWSNADGNASQTFRVCTSFTEQEALALFNDIRNKVGIQIRNAE